MDLEFIASVILISLSGALSPGPLLLSNIIHANKYGYRSGLLISYGHTIVEFPLVLLLGMSSMILELFTRFNMIIGVIGGIALISFASLAIIKHNREERSIIHNPLISGIIFTAFNPFFITWWLTIGMKLINDSLILYSINGILIMFLLHIWIDYAWLVFTAYLTKKGITLLSSRYYKYILFVLNILMIYFGVTFLITSMQSV